MKTALVIFMAAGAVFGYGQQMTEPRIAVTPKEVKPESVRLLSDGPADSVHNVIFRYAGKKSEDIKAIVSSHPRVKIVKDGKTVVPDAGCTGYRDHTGTNYVGLVLLFHSYDEAALAEKTLKAERHTHYE